MTPLVTRAGITAGVMAALTAGAGTGITVVALVVASAAGHDVGHGAHGLWNDFYSYWGAGRVLNAGGSPYDQDRLRDVYAAAGVHPEVGSGYSYPLLLGQLMRPLGLLPATAAAIIFTVASVAALGIAIALLLSSLPDLTPRGAARWGVLLGIAPPVAGSLYVGQINLLLMVPLALAYRRRARAPMIALTAGVKLFPALALAPLVVRGRADRRELARGVAVLLGLLIVPALLSPGAAYSGRLSELMAPDPYWTNVSVNGLVSRLSVPFDGIDPPLRGLPVGPVVAVASGLLTVALAGVLLRSRGRPWELSVALALTVGVMVAPKNSIWNYAPLVIGVVAVWPHLASRPGARRGTVAALALITAGSIGVVVTLLPGPPAVVRIWLASAALAGALLLAGVTAVLLLSPAGPPPPCRPSRPLAVPPGGERRAIPHR